MNLEPFELKIWHTFISKESTDFMASKKAHYLLFALDFSLSYKIINRSPETSMTSYFHKGGFNLATAEAGSFNFCDLFLHALDITRKNDLHCLSITHVALPGVHALRISI